ncbi:MAG: isochorismate synthase, partial [Microbacterium gubbeenense]
MTEPLSLPRLIATTREIEPVEALDFADPSSPTAWIRQGDGLVAAGRDLLHIDVAEDGRISAIADLWRAISQTTDIDDEVGLPGTGLVGFGAFAFDESSAQPSTRAGPPSGLGRRVGRGWR